MLKLFLLQLFLVLMSIMAKGQVSEYTLITYSTQYEELQNPVSLNNGEVWYMPNYTVPLTFDFLYFDTLIDTLYFFEEGFASILTDSNTPIGMHKLIIPFGAALIDRGFGTNTSQSSLSYEVTEEESGKIIKIQWKNAGFYNEYDALGSLNDYINFQLWLYESEGKIDIRYGPNSITHPDLIFLNGTGPSVGLIPSYDIVFDIMSDRSIWINNTPYDPELVYSDEIISMSSMTSDDFIFSFSNLLVSTSSIIIDREIGIKVNPVQTSLCFTYKDIDSDTYNLSIYNNQGMIVLFEQSLLQNSFNVAFLDAGLYICKLVNTQDHTTTMLKFIKVN